MSFPHLTVAHEEISFRTLTGRLITRSGTEVNRPGVYIVTMQSGVNKIPFIGHSRKR